MYNFEKIEWKNASFWGFRWNQAIENVSWEKLANCHFYLWLLDRKVSCDAKVVIDFRLFDLEKINIFFEKSRGISVKFYQIWREF